MFEEIKTYNGGCHCGAVRFRLHAPSHLEALRCNCSMCSKTGFLHIIAPKSRFEIEQGEEQLTTYTFNTGVAKHLFCRHCGVKSFYIPRSNPDGYSVNARCLDDFGSLDISYDDFDGQNWEENAASLAHLSQDETDDSN